MNMFARFDENPAITLLDIKETKRYRRTHARTHARTDGQRENSIPTTSKVCGGYKTKFAVGIKIMNAYFQHLLYYKSERKDLRH